MAFIANMTGILRAHEYGTPLVHIEVLDAFQTCLNEDLDKVFFAPDGQEFSQPISYFHEVQKESRVYNVHFDDPQTTQNVQTPADYNGTKPQILMAEHNLIATPRKGDRITIKGTSYMVENYSSDGVGLMTIYLRFK